MLFRNAFAVQLMLQIGRLLLQIGRLLPRIEAFFRRLLGSYTHRFPKHGEASLTDLPGLRLCLLELRLRLLSCVRNGKAEQQWKGFTNVHHLLKMHTVC